MVVFILYIAIMNYFITIRFFPHFKRFLYHFFIFFLDHTAASSAFGSTYRLTSRSAVNMAAPIPSLSFTFSDTI